MRPTTRRWLLFLKAASVLTPQNVQVRGHLRGTTYVMPHTALRRKAPPDQGGFDFDAEPPPPPPPPPKVARKKPEKTAGTMDFNFDAEPPPPPEKKPEPAPRPTPEKKPEPPPPKKYQDRPWEGLIGVPPSEMTLGEYAIQKHQADPYYRTLELDDSPTPHFRDEGVQDALRREYQMILRKHILTGHEARPEQLQSLDLSPDEAATWLQPQSLGELPIEAILQRGESVLNTLYPSFQDEWDQAAASLRKAEEAFHSQAIQHPEAWAEPHEAAAHDALRQMQDIYRDHPDQFSREPDWRQARELADFRVTPQDLANPLFFSQISYRAGSGIMDLFYPYFNEKLEAPELISDDGVRAAFELVYRNLVMHIRGKIRTLNKLQIDTIQNTTGEVNKERELEHIQRKRWFVMANLLERMKNHRTDLGFQGKSLEEKRAEQQKKREEWLNSISFGSSKDRVSDRINPEALKGARTVLGEIYDLFGRARLKAVIRTNPDRAYFNTTQHYINLGRQATVRDPKSPRLRSVLFHEAGHAADMKDHWNMRECVRKFIEYRCPNPVSKPLSELTGNAEYEKEERAWEDKGINPYVWKDYGNQSNFLSEVVSMGREQFAYPTTMLNLYEVDREHFLLMLATADTLHPQGTRDVTPEERTLKSSILDWEQLPRFGPNQATTRPGAGVHHA